MIRAENLTMHYGPVVALDNVSFKVDKGEIVGLLGPNGAGKSTTMKILTTYLYPTKGKATVGDVDVLADPLGVRKRIGYLPEVLPLYMDMEVQSYLDFVGKARGLSGAQLKDRTNIVLDEVGLRPMYRKVIRELSKGYKQRTAIAQALIHDPDIVILDEPTSGLDPHQIVEIRQLIQNLAKGKTVILSTHILQEVEATADRIVIINRGKIVGDGTVEELRERAKDSERTAVTVSGAKDPAEAERLLSGIEGSQRVELVDEENGLASFVVYSKIGTPVWQPINELARSRNWDLRELAEKPLTLEETFLSLTKPGGGGKA
jgi:ABC-2 type transport system ATP-binding protein